MKKTTIFLALCAVVLLSVSHKISAQTLILTSDQQLNDLMNPDKKIDVSLGYNQRIKSLREICEEGKRQGSKELTVAFDEFFRQYRKDAGSQRQLTPDMDEYVDKIKYISDFAAKYDLGICLSLLSPLELGAAYKKQTGHSGRWVAYSIGFRDPVSGRFSIPMWQQLRWTNNKGTFPITLTGVKAYAFRETPAENGNSPFRIVKPENIVPLEGVTYRTTDALKQQAGQSSVPGVGETSADKEPDRKRLEIYCDQSSAPQGYDRVMVMLEYETPEMDYFNPDALPFLKNLLKKYHDKKVNLTALYSDEMHIQQDWNYFGHHENGQFVERYLTPSMAQTYTQRYGEPFDDRYMLYFVYGAPRFEPTAQAVLPVQYVTGETPEDMHRTFLLRDRYYKLLNHTVVDLFNEAKHYGENLFGRELPTSAHASWAESPTIDLWNYEKYAAFPYQYEYTSNFVWSNTVHQAAAACYDYFKWSEYLQYTGNDFAECGWADRDYYGAAMAASIGVINKYPSAYAAAWGMPDAALERKMAVNNAFGARPPYPVDLLTGGVHRDVDVLILYPMSLVAVEERFGSWMTQYGYANYLSADMLLKRGKVLPDGKIQVGDKRYGTLVALFEPLPEKGLLDMMEQMADKGGKVLWFGVPPLINSAAEPCADQWSKLFGVHFTHDRFMGDMAPGRQINFCGTLQNVPQQTILTDFLVDRIYPVAPNQEVETVALSENQTLGTLTRRPGGGVLGYFGFRPRDDQSQSLGYETRTLFEILQALGAYPSSGKFADINDNPSVVSRTTDYFASCFPNGTTMIVRHYRTHPEAWPGGFSRNAEEDQAALSANPLPTDHISLNHTAVNGHQISYEGRLSMAFRTDAKNRLIGFIGRNCQGITLDGISYTFADQPVSQIAFLPETDELSLYRVQCTGQGEIHLPLPGLTPKAKVMLGKTKIPVHVSDNTLTLHITPDLSGQWLSVTP